MDVGEGLSVSTVCPRLGCAGQDWGPGHSSHHPDDDMRGDQPTLTATLRAEIEVDNTCSTIMIDKIVSVCIRVITTL